MANEKTKKKKILEKASEILKATPNGVRYSELVKRIFQEFPDIPVNTIHGVIWKLEERIPNEIYKPARGLYRHIKFQETEVSAQEQEGCSEVRNIPEEEFYRPFADWLEGEEECTKAMPLGGKRVKHKWGTPDVIGIWKSRASDIVKAIEIVSAEIKADSKDLISAFGQACSYKLFSHKSYIVIPKNSPEEDLSRLVALCSIFGIGLVLFDNSNPKVPGFEIKVSALKHEPDIYYANEYLKLKEIEKDLL